MEDDVLMADSVIAEVIADLHPPVCNDRSQTVKVCGLRIDIV